MATASDPTLDEPPPPRTVAKPLRVAARPATASKPASPAASPTNDPPAAPRSVPHVEPPAPAPSPITDDPSPEPQLALPATPPAPPIKATAAAPPARVAELYATVGKQLKALDQARGSAATADLWLLYLRVRINDVIANPVKCAEADTLLHHLDDEVVKRSR